MLVLTRKPEQSINIGDNIKVTVLGVDGDTVKIGIEAPKELTILREEICREVREENTRAAAIDVSYLKDLAEILAGEEEDK